MARKTGFRSSAAESFRFSKLVICVKCHGFSRGYLQEGVEAIDNDFKEFRLIVSVDGETFRDVVRRRRPEQISCQITNQTDTGDAGFLLIKVDDKVAIETSGVIFPQASGVKGLLSDLPEIQYERVAPPSSGFRRWQHLVLKSKEGE